MITDSIDFTEVLAHWARQSIQYSPSAYVLILCGDTAAIDRTVFDFVFDNRALLDDMTGPYVSLTLVGWRLDRAIDRSRSARDDRRELEYLHAASSQSLGSQGGVYSLANALNLPLNQLPLMVMSLDPWTQEEALVVSFRDLKIAEDATTDRAQRLVDVLSVLVTSCRETRDVASKKRLRIIKKRLEGSLRGPEGMSLSRVVETGIIAQIVEGVVKGLRLNGT